MTNTTDTALPIGPDESAPAYSRLNEIISRAAELLPAQGPITAFVFLNTLQALEDFPFDEGLQKGARLFGCQAYLSEEHYREKLANQRIRFDDLAAVLRDDLGDRGDEQIGSLTTRFELRHAMLTYPLRTGPAEELRWFVAETDALARMRTEAPTTIRERFVEETRDWVMRNFRLVTSNGNRGASRSSQDLSPQRAREHDLLDDLLHRFGEKGIERWSPARWEAFSMQALWRICQDGSAGLDFDGASPFYALRHRDFLLEACGFDIDVQVNELLVRFCAAFTDQGFADWQLPHRNQGFYKSFCVVYGRRAGPPEPWIRNLSKELRRLEQAGIGPRESIIESLELLGVGESEWEQYLTATLVALRGWAGLLWQNEARSDRVALPVPPGTLVEFVAVRLILERVALERAAKHELNFSGTLEELREAALMHAGSVTTGAADRRAFQVFQLVQVLGWSPPKLLRLSRNEWSQLLDEIAQFSGLERRRLFHAAFERRLRIRTLDAFAVHGDCPPLVIEQPKFQAVFCIDAREESFRRHLEEVEPQAETFGAPGFYGIAMYYRGAGDAHFSTLCPVVVKPQHWVVEEVAYSLEQTHRRRAKTRRTLGTYTHQMHMRSRSIAGGAILTAGLGILASVPLVFRVLFPRLTAMIRRGAGSLVEPPPVTRLRLDRMAEPPGPEGDHVGFTLAEMADRGERLLRDIGLTKNFARVVIFFGHGSFCLNNPHKSAYDCGACSGSAGGPNARALAVMLNDPRVRAAIRERGLQIPDDTAFVGGLHNTCADTLTFYDLDFLPRTHRADFEAAVQTLEQVCERNSHERCRRFDSAPLNQSFAAARRHVEARSEDLAQTRPEFGNATNALCYVGRRGRNRGLFLDRRCFMNSYDPLQDDADGTILARILAAAVPVCEGINLQYFFSYIDSPGWGSGTKLPHNVTSLLGVMDGAASDLRSGLPWQGVEIHEPVRLLFVIETTPPIILGIMNRNPSVGKIIRNGWAQLALLDPHSSKILVYRRGEFDEYRPEKAELPRAATSTDWYRGRRDHLEFAKIES